MEENYNDNDDVDEEQQGPVLKKGRNNLIKSKTTILYCFVFSQFKN